MKQIEMTTTLEEERLIDKCVQRLAKDCPTLDRLSFAMDLTACHSNGNPLDFDKLLAADNFNFHHDCYGIMDHMNRHTGKLTDCFSPRCSR